MSDHKIKKSSHVSFSQGQSQSSTDVSSSTSDFTDDDYSLLPGKYQWHPGSGKNTVKAKRATRYLGKKTRPKSAFFRPRPPASAVSLGEEPGMIPGPVGAPTQWTAGRVFIDQVSKSADVERKDSSRRRKEKRKLDTISSPPVDLDASPRLLSGPPFPKFKFMPMTDYGSVFRQ